MCKDCKKRRKKERKKEEGRSRRMGFEKKKATRRTM